MVYKFEDKLRRRARQFIERMRVAGIEAAIVGDSFRDYAVKVAISSGGRDLGKATIYYSPKSDSFSLKTQELKDKSVAPKLEECWRTEGSPVDSPPEDDSRRGHEIYVDGSYLNGATGYGVVILKDGKVVEELFGPVVDYSASDTRQVAGELFAVEQALRWCEKNSVKEVGIFYDYLGIEKWATGAWKANQAMTQDYAKFVRASGVRIRWNKVHSHTGNRWNDRADQLAKKGAGLGAASAGGGDKSAELLDKKDRFLEHLMVKGVDAAFDRIYNEQYARILILRDEKTVG
ncbi:MAG TPA: RNase H family protein, partial [Blastocatellia bacterium]|nr:RNase H family protein [Blastocatellia bacterium]